MLRSFVVVVVDFSWSGRFHIHVKVVGSFGKHTVEQKFHWETLIGGGEIPV